LTPSPIRANRVLPTIGGSYRHTTPRCQEKRSRVWSLNSEGKEKLKKYGANAPQLRHIWQKANTSANSPSHPNAGKSAAVYSPDELSPGRNNTRLSNSPANPTSIVDKRGRMSYHYDVPARGHLQRSVYCARCTQQALERGRRAKTATAHREIVVKAIAIFYQGRIQDTSEVVTQLVPALEQQGYEVRSIDSRYEGEETPDPPYRGASWRWSWAAMAPFYMPLAFVHPLIFR